MKKSFTQTTIWALFLLFISSASLQAQTIYGLTTDSKLVSFSASTPGTLITNVSVTGTKVGQTLVGLDVRPATGELFALGYDATNDSVTVYVLNPTTGVATPKATTIKLTGIGSTIGFDFNPTVDRIRVVSKTGKSYRLNPNNGALAATDSTLRYAATDVNTGKTPGATAAAYTNSFIGATGTQLYVYDETQKVIVFQNPPNDGILNTQPALGGVSTLAIVSDLDIYTNPTTFASTAYAAVRTGALDSLYTLNITTGLLTNIGALGATVVDIAVAINRTLPALQGNLAFGLTFTAGNAAFNFLKFDTKNPNFIRSSQVITGLKTGQTIMGLDMRPQDLTLYALGYRSADSVATIYTLNDTTAILSVYAGADSFKLALGAGQVAFDFNPVANRLRIISAANLNNYRLNLTVNPIAVIVDTALTYKTTDVNTGKTPLPVTGAYTSSYSGSTATQLYDIDAALNNLVNQNTANGGFLNTIGGLGLTLDPTDYTVDLDIFSKKAPLVDSAYLMANITGSGGFDNLYTVNLGTGAATLVGRIGYGIAMRNIAVTLASATTGTQDLPQTLKAALYPNPALNTITVGFDNGKRKAVTVDIYNLQGSLMLRKTYEAGIQDFEKTIDISRLTNGTYFVRIANDSEATVKKFMKL